MKKLTFGLAGEFVAQDVHLMHLSVLFKHFTQVVFVHGARYLADKHLDGVGIGLIATDAVPTPAAAIHPVNTLEKHRFFNEYVIIIQSFKGMFFFLLKKSTSLDLSF